MARKLIEAEVAEARQCLNELKHDIKHGKGLNLTSRLANFLVRGGPDIEDPRKQGLRELPALEQVFSEITTPCKAPASIGKADEEIADLNEQVVAALETFRPGGNARLVRDMEGIDLLFGPEPRPSGEFQLMVLELKLAALKIYKQLLDLEALQEIRESFLPDLMRSAAAWGYAELQAELRKRDAEKLKLPDVTMPRVELFTVDKFRQTGRARAARIH